MSKEPIPPTLSGPYPTSVKTDPLIRLSKWKDIIGTGQDFSLADKVVLNETQNNYKHNHLTANLLRKSTLYLKPSKVQQDLKRNIWKFGIGDQLTQFG